MNRDDAEEYTQALGQVVSGGWRQVALGVRLAVPQSLELSTKDWVDRIGEFARPAIEQRFDAIVELANDGMSNRQIAAVLGISHPTVGRTVGGSNEPASRPDPADTGIDEPVGGSNEPPEIEPAPASPDPAPLDEVEPTPASPDAPVDDVEAKQPKAHVSNNSGEKEWFTPAEYVDAARAVMGGVDLDPASTPEANEVIKAERFYTLADDGLTQDWRGRVWLNPPYETKLITAFCRRVVRTYAAGEVTAACVLVNNATETAWFQTLIAAAAGVCFPRGRVRFWYPGRQSFTPLQGQALIYLGTAPETFRSVFGSFGALR